MPIVVTDIERVDRKIVAVLEECGVATVHEAQGRSGLLAPRLRPIFPGARAAGSAVTVNVPPADNWMLHIAVEQCQDDDVLVVSPMSRSDAGYLGELLATALQARGVRGVVIDAGCRDVSDLVQMGFPVWSRTISAQGTIKATLGDVNTSIVCAGQLVKPGDVVVADDDGVVVVPHGRAKSVAEKAHARKTREDAYRQLYSRGELGLDVHDMRPGLEAKGLRYVTNSEAAEGTGLW